jgi:hypothetical protein
VRKQTHILKRSAEATFLNAQAVINSERPWLVVTWRSDHEVSGLFRFGCRNQGNTPAKVISVSAKASFVDNLNALTIPPDYSSAAVLPDLNLIVHDDSFPIGHGLNPESFVQTSGKKMSLIVDSREFLVYYGNVVYRDTLYTDSSADGLHETRWCFVYQPGREIRKFVRLGHEEYNRYT